MKERLDSEVEKKGRPRKFKTSLVARVIQLSYGLVNTIKQISRRIRRRTLKKIKLV